MSELNRAPQPRAFWDVGTSECSSDSESAPASKQCRQHPEPVEVEEPVTADDETDVSFLMSMAMKSQRMASGHSLGYRILWNAFSKYNGHTLCEMVSSVIDTSECSYLGICSEPLERFALMGPASHKHRYQYMSVLGASDRQHLEVMEQHVLSHLSCNSRLLNKSQGGESIRDKYGYIYCCFSMTKDKDNW